MTHKIKLTGLRVYAHHGVFEFEKQLGQWFVIDASVWLDASQAAANDNIEQTLNYGTLASALARNAATNPVDLLETLASRLLEEIFALGGASVKKAKVTVHKPNAPIDEEFADVSVTVKRRREDG
jgi:dihydroneopterin aldolase